MAIDRAATLRNAEKLLRQGKLELAITEYVRVVEDQPQDWATANTLGDLYLRAGQPDRAVEQFVRLADHLGREGFHPKAAAVYKKILKIRPDDEHALLQAGELAARQGVLVDARSYLKTVIDLRLARADRRGAAEVRVRLGSLDPADIDARRAAVNARVELEDTVGAVGELRAMASDFLKKGRHAEAVALLREAEGLNPTHPGIHAQLFATYMAVGDLAAARNHARTPDHSRALGQALMAAGRMDEAAEFLTGKSSGSDPQLVLKVAAAKVSAGAIDEGIGVLKQLLSEDPAAAVDITRLGWEFARTSPDTGFRVMELTTETAVREGDWRSASAGLQEFVRQFPNHVPALLRLVEICVDGGLDATLYGAQIQLADAYLASGAAAEARVIAEDLVAREPEEPAHAERLHRAMAQLRAEQADAPPPPPVEPVTLPPDEPPAPAEDYSEQDSQPFDLDLERMGDEILAPEMPAVVSSSRMDEASRLRAVDASAGADSEGDRFAHLELSAGTLDIETMFAAIEGMPGPVDPEEVEIDLTLLLDEMGTDSSPPGEPSPVPLVGRESTDLDQLSKDPQKMSAPAAHGAAEREYQRGIALRDAGRIEESVQALEIAARSARTRFRAAASLGRIHRDQGTLSQAIAWFERAAEAPAPANEDGYALLLELAEVLESSGETARALAVCLDLQADAGEYRDVSVRINRLTQSQARG